MTDPKCKDVAVQRLNANNTTAIRERLAGRGYPATKLASERTKIVAFDGYNKDQEIAKGANILATQSKTKEVKALYAWYIEFVRIAKVALKDYPGLLEEMQIPVRTSPGRNNSASLAARKKAAGAAGGTQANPAS